MAPSTTTPTSSLKAITGSSGAKRSFDGMSQPELIKEVQARDKIIRQLEKRLKEAPAAAVISPAKAQEKAEKLKSIAFRGIKSQMKWKPSCKHGTARWSFSGLCDEATFRAFMGIEAGKKTKGGKIPIEDFESKLGCGSIQASIRYGCLYLKGENVNVVFKKDDGEIRITGSYGMYY